MPFSWAPLISTVRCQVTAMLTDETLQQLQRYNFDLLERQELNGQRRMRYIALAHLKDARNFTEVADALRVTRHSVMRWLKWFDCGGVDLAGTPHFWSTQRPPKTQEEAFRQAVEQLQHRRGDGRVRGEDIRQLLAEQFAVSYSLNGVYDLLKRLDMAWISARSISHSSRGCVAWSGRYLVSG
jgi:transposase